MKRAVQNTMTAIQEHKLKPGEMKKAKEIFKEAGLKLECGPSDCTTKVPNAGVGMAVKDEVVFLKTQKRSEAFRLACEQGRAEKYLVDLGWEKNLLCFIIYGVSGGSGEAKDTRKPLRRLSRKSRTLKTTRTHQP